MNMMISYQELVRTFLSLFSLTLGSALIAFGLPATVVGFVGVVIAGAIGAFIDDKFVDELNHKIIK